MTPVISIIVPVYKVEKQLKRCIDSILAQTFSDFELILIDDGSPDECPAICDEYAKKDERIRVIHKKNEGLAEVRNVGIKEAACNYIGFVDSDDFISPEMYEKLYLALTGNDADLSICYYCKCITKNGKESLIPEEFSYKEGVYDSDTLTKILFSPQSGLAAVAWNKLYKKELFKGVHYPKGKIHEDEAAAHMIIYNTQKAVIIEDVLYYYSVNDEGIINAPFSLKNFDALDYCVDRLEFYKKHKNKDHYNLALKGYWNILNRFLKKSVSSDKSIIEARKRMKKQFDRYYFSIITGSAFGFKEKLVITLYFLSPGAYEKKFIRKGNA